MEMLRQALPRVMLVSALVLFCLLSFGLAEKRTDSHSPTETSDRLITIRLTMSDGRVILVSQYDKGIITTEMQDGQKLSITVHALDNGAVSLKFFRVPKTIKKGAETGGTLVGIGSMELNSALPRATPIRLISSIELIGIAKVMMEGAAVRVSLRVSGPCPCCVTCAGNETCGVSVILSCGSCTCD